MGTMAYFHDSRTCNIWSGWYPCKDFHDSKLHGANKGPIWGRQDPGVLMLAPWTLLSGVVLAYKRMTSENKYRVMLSTVHNNIFDTSLSSFDFAAGIASCWLMCVWVTWSAHSISGSVNIFFFFAVVNYIQHIMIYDDLASTVGRAGSILINILLNINWQITPTN